MSSARAAHRSNARGSFVLWLLRAPSVSRLRRCIAPATPLPAGLGRLWTTGSHCGWSLSVRNGRRGERERGAPSGELSRTVLRLLQQRLMAPCTATASAPQLPPRGHPVWADSERLAAAMMRCLTCETTSVPSVNVGARSITAAAAAPTQPPPLDLVALATSHPPCSSPRPSPALRAFLAPVSYS